MSPENLIFQPKDIEAILFVASFRCLSRLNFKKIANRSFYNKSVIIVITGYNNNIHLQTI